MKKIQFPLFLFFIIININGGYRLLRGIHLPKKITRLLKKNNIKSIKRFYKKQLLSSSWGFPYFNRLKNLFITGVKHFKGDKEPKLEQFNERQQPYIENISFIIDLSTSNEFITHQVQGYKNKYQNHDWQNATIVFSYNENQITFETKKTKNSVTITKAFDLLLKFIIKRKKELQAVVNMTKIDKTPLQMFPEMQLHEEFLKCFKKTSEF